MTTPKFSDPQPRRALIEPANGIAQWQDPIRHTPQGLDRAGHPFPPHPIPRSVAVALLAALALIVTLVVLAAIGRA